MALWDYVSGSSNWSDPSSVALVVPSLSVTVGNLVFFIGKWEGSGASDNATFTINDGGRGLSWSTPVYATPANASADERVGIAWAQVGTTGAAVVTATFDGGVSRAFQEMHLHQFELGAGYTPSQIASQTGVSTTGVTTWATTSLTTTTNDFIAVALATGSGTFTPAANSPLTVEANAQGRSVIAAGKVASGGTTAVGGTITAAATYAAVALQIRAASAGGGASAKLLTMLNNQAGF